MEKRKTKTSVCVRLSEGAMVCNIFLHMRGRLLVFVLEAVGAIDLQKQALSLAKLTLRVCLSIEKGKLEELSTQP